MKNEKILKMINEGKIEELKELIQEEIYEDSLKNTGKANEKTRYAAMKRYFKFSKMDDQRLRYPCKDVEVAIRGIEKKYNCFCDGHSAVLTGEKIGILSDFNEIETEKEYFNIKRIFPDFSQCVSREININEVLAQAKAKGYKFNKEEVGLQVTMFAQEGDIYIKVGLLDQAYSIINDGKKAKVCVERNALFVETEIGICCVLPCKYNGKQDKVIIEAEK